MKFGMALSSMTAGGMERAPVIEVTALNCLGQMLTNFSAVALNLPFHPLMSGLLGMDFLGKTAAPINIKKAEIIIDRESTSG